MIIWRTGTVLSTGTHWPGASELTVTLDRPLPHDGPREVRALAYTRLVGDPRPGDTLLLNVTALARGLGTGGYALVIGPADHTGTPPDPAPGPGHLVKARYTPLQTMVLGADEQESDHHDLLRDADTLDDMPVVVADLHSALPAVIAGARHAAAVAGRPAPVIAYLMTDGGALPAAFSRTIAALRDADWLHTCITTGQAFGGDLETVTVHTGLLAAHHIAHADIAVVTQGPGNLGTGTRWGYSGVATGEHLNATTTLGGHPIASLRVSGADARTRHHGISHHSLTSYTHVALTGADIPIPAPTPDIENLPGWGPELTTRIRQQTATLPTRHRLVDVPADTLLLETLRTSPAGLRTMGRTLQDDPASFTAAAVAGVHAYHAHRDRP